MFWTNYSYLCKQINKSPNAVAAEIGVSSSGTVTRWKNDGAVPRPGLLNKIADYFGVYAADLLYTDLSAKKMPSLEYEEEHKKYVNLGLDDLSDEELRRVSAFVAGIKASRDI